MNESLPDTAVADLARDLRRLSAFERDFLHRWRCALGLMSSTPQLAQVFDRVQRLAASEAKAQRDEDLVMLAALERLEFEPRTAVTAPPAAERRKEQMKPVTQARPTAGPACSTASGTIASASMVSTAPAANVSVNASVVAPAPPRRP